MQNDVMTDKFIDYVNDRIEDLDMTKSSLARSVGLEYGYQQNLRYSD